MPYLLDELQLAEVALVRGQRTEAHRRYQRLYDRLIRHATAFDRMASTSSPEQPSLQYDLDEEMSVYLSIPSLFMPYSIRRLLRFVGLLWACADRPTVTIRMECVCNLPEFPRRLCTGASGGSSTRRAVAE